MSIIWPDTIVGGVSPDEKRAVCEPLPEQLPGPVIVHRLPSPPNPRDLRAAGQRQAATLPPGSVRPMGHCHDLQRGAFDPAAADELAKALNQMNADIDEGVNETMRELALGLAVVVAVVVIFAICMHVWPPVRP